MKQQKGFTLIELVVVIVLLGILGAAATARFQDLSTEAGNAAAQGVAGELAAGSAINYGAFQVGLGTAQTITAATACDTSTGAGTLASLLQQGAFPADITITDGASDCTTAGTTKLCNVGHNNGNATAVASIICTS